MESNTKNLTANKTLMNALNLLNERCNQLNEIKSMSINLNEKLNRTENHPKGEDRTLVNKDESLKNIVDLFMDVSEELQQHIEIIGFNLNTAINIIE